MINSYKIVSGRPEYGGQVYLVEFTQPATECDIKEVAYTLDDCPFGWRLLAGGPGSTRVSIKIHND